MAKSWRRHASTHDLLDNWRYFRARALREGPVNNRWRNSYAQAFWSWKFLCDRWGVSMDVDHDLQRIIEGRYDGHTRSIENANPYA